MSKEERIELLKSAHQEMVNWWNKEIDTDGGTMAPCSFHVFLQHLLTFSEETYWNRWIGNKIPIDKKQSFKAFILSLIIKQIIKNEKIITHSS
jgi:hypothetical protein